VFAGGALSRDSRGLRRDLLEREVPEGLVRPGRGAVVAIAVLALAATSGCAGPGGERKSEPVGVSQALGGVRLRVGRNPAPLEQEVGAALETALARAGVPVLTDDRAARDADVTVTLDLRSVGPVIEGVATASVERDGVLVDRVSTALDVYRRDRFAALVAGQLADLLARSPRVAALRTGAPPTMAATAPPAPTVALAPAAAPVAPMPAYVPLPPVAPPPAPVATSGPEALGRSGRFGVGFSLELQTGVAQVFAPGGSPAGVWLALAAQVDMGPRAAFRLTLHVVAASSGDEGFAEIAFTPTYIYRFRHENDQAIVPYVGLGAKLAFVEGGRTLLGRPLTGMATADSCSRRHSLGGSTTTDCSFAISPEPVAGVEWHANRLFALDIAASYSFARLTSSDGAVSWINLLSIFVAPRLSF
jgi:hypothetical protein